MTEVVAEKPFTRLTAARQRGVVFGGGCPKRGQTAQTLCHGGCNEYLQPAASEATPKPPKKMALSTHGRRKAARRRKTS
jgi:hypothetical protein